jgi:hypothetical protein
MTTVQFTIPDAITPRVLNGYCKYRGYSATLDDGTPNPETKAAFFKRTIIDYIKQSVKASEIQDASQAAAATAGQAADQDIQIT